MPATTRNAIFKMEKANSEMTENVMTKAKEIQDMTSRLKKEKELKMKRTKQLEEIQNSFDKLGDAKETESSNLDGIIDITKLKGDPDEYNFFHEETLSKIRQHHEDVLSDFERQLQAVKGKNPRPEKKKANKNKR